MSFQARKLSQVDQVRVDTPLLDFDLPLASPVVHHDPWELYTEVPLENHIRLCGLNGAPFDIPVNPGCTLEEWLHAEINLGTLPGPIQELMASWIFLSCPAGEPFVLSDVIQGRTVWIVFPEIPNETVRATEVVPYVNSGDQEITPTVPWTAHGLPHDTDLGPATPDPWSQAILEQQALLSPAPLLALDRRGLLTLKPIRVMHLGHLQALSQIQWTSKDRLDLLQIQGDIWADDEIEFHLKSFVQESGKHDWQILPPLLATEACLRDCQHLLRDWVMSVPSMKGFVSVTWFQGHWTPWIWYVNVDTLRAESWDVPGPHLQFAEGLHEQLRVVLGRSQYLCQVINRDFAAENQCGVCAVRFLDQFFRGKMLPSCEFEAGYLNKVGRTRFQEMLRGLPQVPRPWMWGAGLDPSTHQKLLGLLAQHGVPKGQIDNRATLLIQAVGIQTVCNALQGTNAWRALKAAANQLRPPFQLVLPEELEAVIQARSAQGNVKKKQKNSAKSKPKPQPALAVLDPSRLGIDTGTFIAGASKLAQISLRQIGPFSEGVVLTTCDEASKFLRSSQKVTSLALALVVLNVAPDVSITPLPHEFIRVVLRCLADKDPVLAPACLVQLGEVKVTQFFDTQPSVVPQVEAACLKVSIYQDSVIVPWEEVVGAPIRYLLKVVEPLSICREDPATCSCLKWHPKGDEVIQEPILDLWRRQWLSSAFKPSTPDLANVFMVNLRVVSTCLQTALGFLMHRNPQIFSRQFGFHVVIWLNFNDNNNWME